MKFRSHLAPSEISSSSSVDVDLENDLELFYDGEHFIEINRH